MAGDLSERLLFEHGVAAAWAPILGGPERVECLAGSGALLAEVEHARKVADSVDAVYPQGDRPRDLGWWMAHPHKREQAAALRDAVRAIEPLPGQGGNHGV